MLTNLDETLNRILKLPPEQLAVLQKVHEEVRKKHVWVPNPGPQTQAYFSEADEARKDRCHQIFRRKYQYFG